MVGDILYSIGKNAVLAPLAAWEAAVGTAYAFDYFHSGVADGFVQNHELYIGLMAAPVVGIATGVAVYKTLSALSDATKKGE